MGAFYYAINYELWRVNNDRSKNILASMGIDLDTKRFELKLRAIAKHAGALADELDAIDKGDDNNDQRDCL